MRRSYHNANGNSYEGRYKGETQLLEEENENTTSELKDKVKTLKSLTIEMGNEIRSQNQFLNDMDDDFGRSGGILEQTMRRLGFVSKGSHNYHILILFLFCFFVFLLLWLVLKFR
ncbi:BET1-like protein [Armadillidium vulgare]|nr:BET1-like protein [Armadillidium vulgare]